MTKVSADDLARVAREIERRHPEVGSARVEWLVAAAFDDFRDARVRQFVPLLVLRQIEDRLRAVSLAS